MRYKTSELTGAILDAVVAMSEGLCCDTHDLPRAVFVHSGADSMIYDPSKNWALAGPIIERERIALVAATGYEDDGPVFWTAACCGPDGAYSHYIDEPLPFSDHGQKEATGEGPTPLIAAMRAYVASKLGDEAEL